MFPWAAAIVLAAITGLVVWNLQPTEFRTVSRSEYALPDGLDFRNTGGSIVAVSPSGEHFLYNSTDGIYIRSMNEFEARLIPGTEGSLWNPVFSPDGQEIAYRLGDGQLMKIAISGGAPIVLAESSGGLFGMRWERDGTILYGQTDGIWQVSENGGTPVQLIATEEDERVYGPQLLPGGEWVLFTLASTANSSRWDEANIVIESLSSGERRVLRPGGSDGRYVPTGHLVYALENGLFALPLDINSVETSGGPVSIIQGVQRPRANTGAAVYSFSNNGTLIYVPGAAASGFTATSGVLTWVDRNGAKDPLPVPPRPYRHPRLSPDATRLAVQTTEASGQSAIWIYDLDGGNQMRQMTGPGNNMRPIWSPDGEWLTFVSDRGRGAENLPATRRSKRRRAASV